MDMKPEGGKKAVWEADEDFSLIGEEEDKDYIRYDLACGKKKRQGFIGLDISNDSDADFICNLERYPWTIFTIEESMEGIPLQVKRTINENSVNEINCSHFVEHVSSLHHFMECIWMVLVPGGTAKITAPYWTHIGADQDFNHKRRINEMTFQYFCQPSLRGMNINHYNVLCDFDITLTRFVFEPEWVDRSEEAKEWARKHYNNVVREIEVYLKAVKPMRKS